MEAPEELARRQPRTGLHAFQKRSKSGIATPKRDLDLIHQRLAEAERLHREREN